MHMVYDLLSGLMYSSAAFIAIMATCIGIGKLAGKLSPYQDHQ